MLQERLITSTADYQEVRGQLSTWEEGKEGGRGTVSHVTAVLHVLLCYVYCCAACELRGYGASRSIPTKSTRTKSASQEINSLKINSHKINSDSRNQLLN